ncbi:ATP-binding protein [Streptomyces sp. NPDC001833]|uniref:ATP-binding protein n=1 Tax=Streptomyces sp. NPDC001833 TaxID=3154658 RepID=UPI00331CADAD
MAQKYQVARSTVAKALRLEDFGFEKNPDVAPAPIGELRNPVWVSEGHPAVLIGASGTGKSHLLTGIGTTVAEAGLAAPYSTTSAPVNGFAGGNAAKRLSGVIFGYGQVDLLGLDEFGCLNLAKTGSKLLFQIFIEREERKATAAASHTSLSTWDKTFTGPRLYAAIADRLTDEETPIQTGTASYRLKAAEYEYWSARRS